MTEDELLDLERRALLGAPYAVTLIVSAFRDSRRHAALLTADIEGWKKQAEMLRARLAEKDAELTEVHQRLYNERAEFEAMRAEKDAEIARMTQRIRDTSARFRASAKFESIQGAATDEMVADVLDGLMIPAKEEKANG